MLDPIGTVTCTGATPNVCSATVHYTPNSPSGDFVGDDTFTYQANEAPSIATPQPRLSP